MSAPSSATLVSQTFDLCCVIASLVEDAKGLRNLCMANDFFLEAAGKELFRRVELSSTSASASFFQDNHTVSSTLSIPESLACL